jgi:hypothetical protein
LVYRLKRNVSFIGIGHWEKLFCAMDTSERLENILFQFCCRNAGETSSSNTGNGCARFENNSLSGSCRIPIDEGDIL